MVSALILLLIVLLLLRALLALGRACILWLGRGKSIYQLAHSTKPSELAYAEDLRNFSLACEQWRRSHTGLRRFAHGRPRLTREQKRRIQQFELTARSAYLQMLHVGLYQVVIIFLLGSVLGLVLEQIWMFITAGLTQSRVGLVWGPFSPLYGFGATLLTLLCWQLQKRTSRWWQVFLVSMCLGGVLEQLTGWAMQALFHMSSWSYLHLPDHLSQWVALRFLLMWGLLGLVWARAIMPELLYRIGMPTTVRQVVFVSLLALYLTADIGMTLTCFARMQARKAHIPPQNAFEQWVDTHYTDQFIAGRFQNMIFEES